MKVLWQVAQKNKDSPNAPHFSNRSVLYRQPFYLGNRWISPAKGKRLPSSLQLTSWFKRNHKIAKIQSPLSKITTNLNIRFKDHENKPINPLSRSTRTLKCSLMQLITMDLRKAEWPPLTWLRPLRWSTTGLFTLGKSSSMVSALKWTCMGTDMKVNGKWTRKQAKAKWLLSMGQRMREAGSRAGSMAQARWPLVRPACST